MTILENWLGSEFLNDQQCREQDSTILFMGLIASGDIATNRMWVSTPSNVWGRELL